MALQGNIKLNEWRDEASWGMIVVLSLIELSALISLGPLAPQLPSNSPHLFAVCSACLLLWARLPVTFYILHCDLVVTYSLWSSNRPVVSPWRHRRDVRVSLPFKCIFYKPWRHGEEAGPLFAASSGAKDSLMLISMHLSPWAASCLPQLLIHFLFFLCLSSPSPFVFSASVFFFLVFLLFTFWYRAEVSLPHDGTK